MTTRVVERRHREWTLERIQSRVQVTPAGCWEWLGARTSRGYGSIGHAGRALKAHRLAYELATGRSPGKLFVCHRCDNPPCCNPEHLFLGTAADNMRDMAEKGRAGVVPLERHPLHCRPELRAFGSKNGAHTQPEKRPRGAAHGRARLSVDQVEYIRATAKRGNYSVIARELGVDNATVGRIARGELWKQEEP